MAIINKGKLISRVLKNASFHTKLTVPPNEVPYISSYYIKPMVLPGEDVIIDFYVSDYHNLHQTRMSNHFRYRVVATANDREIILSDLLSGDHQVNFGSFSEETEVKISLTAYDQFGRSSYRLFTDVLVANPIERTTYQVTEQDIIDYGITYNVTREIKQFVDCSTLETIDNTTVAEAIAAAEATCTPESETYVCLIADRYGDGIYRGKHGDFRRNRVVYAEDYDKAAVREECSTNRHQIQKLLEDKMQEGYNHIIFYPATYIIDEGEGVKDRGILIPNGLDLDLNGATIKLNPFIGSGTMMVTIMDSKHTHVHNGTIEGDYFSHDYANSEKNSEWVSGVSIEGDCHYCSFYDLTVKDITGYGLNNGMSQRSPKGYTNGGLGITAVGTYQFGDIDRVTGEFVPCHYRTTSEMKKFVKDNVDHEYVSISIYLGYQGNPCDNWNIVLHFYDENQSYLESIPAYQYRNVRIPKGARYLRSTILGVAQPTNLNYHFFYRPTHCEFKHILVDNARCVGCAPSQMWNMLFDDIEFIGSGQSGANCALDAEDGWDTMHDCTFRRLNFHDNPANNFLLCAGHNFIVEDSPLLNSIYIWGRTRGFVIRNSTFGGRIHHDGLLRSYHPRVENCTLNSGSIAGETVYFKNCQGTVFSGSSAVECQLINLSGGVTCSHSTFMLSGSTDYIGSVNCSHCDFRATETDGSYRIRFNDTSKPFVKRFFFNDCHFYDRSILANNNGFCGGEFKNCQFDSVAMEVGFAGSEVDQPFYFKSCQLTSLTNSDKMFQFKPFVYTIDETHMVFEDCTITNSGSLKQLFDCYSCPTGNSLIEFKNCTFVGFESVMIIKDYYGFDSREEFKLTIRCSNCIGLPEAFISQPNTLGRLTIEIL